MIDLDKGQPLDLVTSESLREKRIHSPNTSSNI